MQWFRLEERWRRKVLNDDVLGVNKHDNLQVGYMNVFQQVAAGNRYRSIHRARLFFFHNLDGRKK